MTGYQCENCREIYWPNECEATKKERGETLNFCPSCNQWTPEHQVDVSDPAFDGNQQ